MLLRRIIQGFSLALFLLLLLTATYGAISPAADFYLRADPALALGTGLAALHTDTYATLLLSLWPALAVLVSALFLGRAFCGWICPMGTTLDCSDHFTGKGRDSAPSGHAARQAKYAILAGVLASSLLSVSLVFLASPLALVTRLYALVLIPWAALTADAGLGATAPVLDDMGLTGLAMAQFKIPWFATSLFILGLFVLLFILGRRIPRFWCRSLCPAGACLALLSDRPLIRRKVSDDCIECGKCIRACPMRAIPLDPAATSHRECVLCKTCRDVCPVDAVSFPATLSSRSGNAGAENGPGGKRDPLEGYSPSRRMVLAGGLIGAGAGLAMLTGLSPASALPPDKGKPEGDHLVRPPGAVPERSFLAKCVRCGECMAACPTNTIQPIWFQSGFAALFSPVLEARRGPCDPRCTRCGQACPTEAIRSLEPGDRAYAKTGTARIHRNLCLAWEHGKRCLVCDEVCPFDAVELRPHDDHVVHVPYVIEDKCSGCGFCEHYCPVRNEAAIRVTPMGEIRLAQGSYKTEASFRNLRLALDPKKRLPTPSERFSSSAGSGSGYPDQGEAPGFTPLDEAEAPPETPSRGNSGPKKRGGRGNAPGFTP